MLVVLGVNSALEQSQPLQFLMTQQHREAFEAHLCAGCSLPAEQHGAALSALWSILKLTAQESSFQFSHLDRLVRLWSAKLLTALLLTLLLAECSCQRAVRASCRASTCARARCPSSSRQSGTCLLDARWRCVRLP